MNEEKLNLIFLLNQKAIDYEGFVDKWIELREKGEGVTCNFCKKQGFDLMGLKYHINNGCSVFEETENLL